jgi:PTS system nitrogen regulatory IIA component
MKLTDILSPERVIHRLEASDKDGVLAELVRRGLIGPERNAGLQADDERRVLRTLLERERLGSTGIKDGLAIPHGKLEGLSQLTACIGIHPTGLDFGSIDHLPSRIFIVLLAPQTAGAQHLKALARISRLFSDSSLPRRLLDAASSEAIFEEVASEDARY